MGLADNIERVQERIAHACARSGRNLSEVTLVAVSKTCPAEIVAEAYRLGLRDFGENRVEEAREKIPNAKYQISNSTSDLRLQTSELRWHLVGHLQSRKAAEAVALFDVIHSVDSVKLANKLSRLCIEAGRMMPILLECNVSGEASKYGFPAATAADKARWIADVEAILAEGSGVRVEGLMTVAPIVSQAQDARPVFRALRQLRDELASRFPQTNWRHLSMGMTDDFEIAIEEGATLVRVGRAIFGERQQA
jgi:pyridoxal phosphate enzyme (YggS family)